MIIDTDLQNNDWNRLRDILRLLAQPPQSRYADESERQYQDFVQFVYKRAATIPTTPTGNDIPATWNDGPPAADGNPLWQSKSYQRHDGQLVGTWDTPIQLDGDGVEIQYSIDGSTNWHDTFTGGDIYMRQRVFGGTYSDAIRIVGEKGDTGDTGPAGLGDIDFPATTGIVFTDAGSGRITWTTGNLKYKGTDYTIAIEETGDTNKYIYWDLDDSNTTFKTTDTLATAIGANKWIMCYNDAGTPHIAAQNKVIHGGIIQADTITAINIVAQTITFDELRQTGGSEAVDTDAMRDDATTLYQSQETSGLSAFLPGFGGGSPDYLEIQSLTETSLGGVVNITAACVITSVDSYSVTVRLFQDSSEIASLVLNAPNGEETPFILQAVSVPGSGEVVYSLTAESESSFDYPNDHKAKNRVIIYSEPKGK